ncbi:hypothetical protein GCM10009722_23870 [Williamsia deligens]|nr:Protein N-acetyltransferase, RimJ/RimL family [Williamsia deligens]
MVLGPVMLGDRRVRLRPPVLDDHGRWREVRLRDQSLIEPFWVRNDHSWPDRHRRNEWVREVLAARAAALRGRSLPCAIEVDGEFAGQCILTAIDHATGTAELGVWIDSALARSGVATLAVGLIADHAFGAMGLRRIVAPTAADNLAAARASERAGFRREATLPGWAPTGADDIVAHDLWVLDRDHLPTGGLTTVAIRRVDPGAPAVDVATLTRPARHGRERPRSLADATSMTRFALGGLRRRLRRMMPAPVPAGIGVTGTDLRLRRRGVATAMSPGRRSHAFDDICTPMRDCAWFDTDEADVAYDIVADHRAVGRIALVGMNRSLGFAELFVTRDPRASATTDAAMAAAVGEIVDVATNLLRLERITTITDPDDEHANRIADAAGFRDEGRIDGAAYGRPAGVVNLWGVSATRTGAATA